jgi:hypothetical protein
MNAGPTLTVCRDCCCGTSRKHPGVDHRAQLERFRAAPGRLRVSDCLDACAYSNVVVVSPSTAGRAAGARPVWLFGVLDDETEAEVVAWVEAGGPGWPSRRACSTSGSSRRPGRSARPSTEPRAPCKRVT